MEDVNVNSDELMWAKRFAGRNNFGFADSDDEDQDWEIPNETYVVSSQHRCCLCEVFSVWAFADLLILT